LKRRAFFAVVLLVPLLGQQPKPKPILPDGIIRRTEEHRIELSGCDTVHISGPVEQLDVQRGEFDAYWFRKYGIEKLHITCEIEVRK
jgi:hypothetical protein